MGEMRPDNQTPFAMALSTPIRQSEALEANRLKRQWEDNTVTVEQGEPAEVAPFIQCVDSDHAAVRGLRRFLAAELDQVGEVSLRRDDVDYLQSFRCAFQCRGVWRQKLCMRVPGIPTIQETRLLQEAGFLDGESQRHLPGAYILAFDNRRKFRSFADF